MVLYHISIEIYVFAIDKGATGTFFVCDGEYVSVNRRLDMSHHDDGMVFADGIFHQADVGLGRTTYDIASLSNGKYLCLSTMGGTDQ